MKVHLLALDYSKAVHTLKRAEEAIGDGKHATSLVLVGGLAISGARCLIVPGVAAPPRAGMELDLWSRLSRTVQLNHVNRANWRAVSRSADVVRELKHSDLVVVGDDLSVRTGWMLARRYGVPVVGRITGLSRVLGAHSSSR